MFVKFFSGPVPLSDCPCAGRTEQPDFGSGPFFQKQKKKNIIMLSFSVEVSVPHLEAVLKCLRICDS